MDSRAQLGLDVTSFVFPLPLNLGSRTQILVSSAKRYRASHQRENPGSTPVVLLFAHGLGHHKEQWEPTLAKLFQLSDSKASPVLLKEAWCLDCPDHGESASFNAAELERCPRFISCYDYGQFLVTLLQSGHIGSFPKGRVIMIGHSAGASSIILATAFFPSLEDLPFDSLILIEPAVISSRSTDMDRSARDFMNQMVRLSSSQRDTWRSRDDAKRWLRARAPWISWDTRCIDLYVKYGLRPIPTAQDPSAQPGVTLACTKGVQTAAYSHTAIHQEVLDCLSTLCKVIPVHVIFGNIIDYMPQLFQEAVCSRDDGRLMVSITRIADAGHMIVQEKPDVLAEHVFTILCNKILAVARL
ncbi:Alpha/beta hydrolase fold-1 [Armillaria nabsnona]|nr:Alpha/beta hydrolase fold-1 [Armillaria nabsnona]